MESLLPSEIARLVYGYLTNEGCYEAAEKFLQTSPHLTECQKLTKQGRRFHTHVLGRSLTDMLDVFSTVYSIVQEKVENSQEVVDNSGLLNRFQQLLNIDCSKHSTGSHPSRNFSAPKVSEVDIRHTPGNCILNPHATSTPYSNVLPNGCYDNKNATPTTGASNSFVRRQLLSEKENENERTNVNQEALQVFFHSVNKTLLDSTQIHQKLAEKINEKITSVENQPPDTIAKDIVTGYDFDSFVDEILESANSFETKSKDQNTLKENNCKVLDGIEPVDGNSIDSNKALHSLKNRPGEKGRRNTIEDENAKAIEGILNNQNRLPNEGFELQDNVGSIATISSSSTSSTTTIAVAAAASTCSTLVSQDTGVSANHSPDRSKSIIEKALMSSFISPVKQGNSNAKNSTSSNILCENNSNTIISNKSNQMTFASNQCLNGGILSCVNQNQELYSSPPTVVINSLPGIASSNFILTSPVSLPVSIVSPVVSSALPVSLKPRPSKLVQILPAPIQSAPSVVTASIPCVNSMVGTTEITPSCKILTSGSASTPSFDCSGTSGQYQSRNFPETDPNKPSKILLENVSWREKRGVLHGRPQNQVMKKKLTKITPKPSAVDFQESFCKPGSKKVLPNGIAVEVLSQDALSSISPSPITNDDTEKKLPADGVQLSEETKEDVPENYNDINATEVNDSDLMVIDTSRSEIVDSDVQNDETAKNSDKPVDKNQEKCVDDKATDKRADDVNINSPSMDVSNSENLEKESKCLKNNDTADDNAKNVIDNNNVSDSLSVVTDLTSLTNEMKYNTEKKKDKTPGWKPSAKKIRSMSTPRRRSSHIRALDFGTPERRIKSRKTNTSPKSASRLKSTLKMNKHIKSKLFRSPKNKVVSPIKENNTFDEVAPGNLGNDTILLTTTTPKKDDKSSDINDVPTELRKENQEEIPGNDVETTGKDNLNPNADNKVIKSPEKRSALKTNLSVLNKTPIKILDATDSPVPKLTGDWDAVNGLGMIVGKNSPVRENLDKKTVAVKEIMSWDSKLRSFIDPSSQVSSPSPKKKHIRRKIGSNRLNDNKMPDNSCKKKENADSVKNKDSVVMSNEIKNHVENNKPGGDKVKRLRNRKLKKSAVVDDLSLSSSTESISESSSSELTDNEDLSLDMARKIERNILNSDSVNLSESNLKDNQKIKITNFSNCLGENTTVKRMKDDGSKQENSPSLESNKALTFISPEQNITKTKITENSNQYQQMPMLETPIKTDFGILPPQTPILNTPMLKSIQQDTSVVLLTPNFPPTPAGLKTKDKFNNRTPFNSHKSSSDITPLKSFAMSPIKKDEGMLEQVLIHECERIETREVNFREGKNNEAKSDCNISSDSSLTEKTKENGNDSIISTTKKYLVVSCAKLDLNKCISPVKEGVNANKSVSSPLKMEDKNKNISTTPSKRRNDNRDNNSPNISPLKRVSEECENIYSSAKSSESAQTLTENLMSNKDISPTDGKLLKEKLQKEIKKKKKSGKTKKKSKNDLIKEMLRNAVQSVFGTNSSSSSDSDHEETKDSHAYKKSVDDKLNKIGSVTKKSVSKSKKNSPLIKHVNDDLTNSKSVVEKAGESSHPVIDKTGPVLSESIVNETSEKSKEDFPVADKEIENKSLSINDSNNMKNNVTKPKKYVKTILLSSNVSIKKFPKKPDETLDLCVDNSDKHNVNIETQRALLNEKKQRTINKLREVSNKNTPKNVVKTPKFVKEFKNKVTSNNIKDNYKSKALVDDTSESEEEEKPKDKISPVFKEKVISSAELVNKGKESLTKDKSDSLPTCKKINKQKPSGNDKKTSVEPSASQSSSQIIFLQSNEGYVHMIHDGKSVSSGEKKVWKELENYEIAYTDENQVICKISVQPLQTLLEIPPSEFKKNGSKYKEHENISTQGESSKFKGSDCSYYKSKNSTETQDKKLSGKSKEIVKKSFNSSGPDNAQTVKSNLDCSGRNKEHENDKLKKGQEEKDLFIKNKESSSSKEGKYENEKSYRDSRSSRKCKDRENKRRSSPGHDQHKSSFVHRKYVSSRSKSSDSRNYIRSRKDRQRFSYRSSFYNQKKIRSRSRSPGTRRRLPSLDKKNRSSSRRRKSSPFQKKRRSRSLSPSLCTGDSPATNEKSRKKHNSPVKNKNRSSSPRSESDSDNEILSKKNDKSSKSSVPASIKCEKIKSETPPSLSVNIIRSKKNMPDNSDKSLNSTAKKPNANIKDLSLNKSKCLVKNSETVSSEEDLEDGEILSLAGDDDNELDLMDLAVTNESSVVKRNPTAHRMQGKVKLLTPRKRKASDDLAHGADKKHKSDDAQRLLKNLDSEDLEQFLSAVHSETEK